MIKALLNIKFFIMKKQFLNLGKTLSKAEQRTIQGGLFKCSTSGTCSPELKCCSGLCVYPGSWADVRYCGM